MVVLITYKNDEDPIKNEGARLLTRLYFNFSHARTANSTVSGRIRPKFELIQAFMVVLVPCKIEDPIKNEGAMSANDISPIISLWFFFSDAQGHLTPQSSVE